MAEKIEAQVRENFGKGASRQMRRDGRTPAVVYGKGVETLHISFDAHELFLATKGKKAPVLEIALDGKTVVAQVKEIQRHPVARIIEHVDLVVTEA